VRANKTLLIGSPTLTGPSRNKRHSTTKSVQFACVPVIGKPGLEIDVTGIVISSAVLKHGFVELVSCGGALS
jgi:hypothetical protein